MNVNALELVLTILQDPNCRVDTIVVGDIRNVAVLQALAKGLSNSNNYRFTLSFRSASSQVVQALWPVLLNPNSQVSTIALQSMTPETAKALWSALRHPQCRIKRLDLSALDAEGTTALLLALTESTSSVDTLI